MLKRLTAIILIPCVGGLAGGFVVWLTSYVIFYLVVIYPRREMAPMLAASSFCGDCLGWGIITLFLMVLGVAAGAVLGKRMANYVLHRLEKET
jgi:F0F1-type ATP synthase assembly protein I